MLKIGDLIVVTESNHLVKLVYGDVIGHVGVIVDTHTLTDIPITTYEVLVSGKFRMLPAIALDLDIYSYA